MPDSTSIASLCDDLAAEHAVLDCIVSELTDTQWLLATPAEPWTIRDQIAHLAYFDERAIDAVTRPDEFIAHVADFAADIESSMERHLELDGGDGPAALERWRVARAGMLGALRRLDIMARVPWYGPAMSAQSFITARLMETWAHGRDVADALGIDRGVSTRLIHVAFLGVRTFAWSHQVRGLPVPESPPRVELRGPEDLVSTWNQDGDGLVAGPLEDFCLVVTQRRHVDDTALRTEGAVARRWMEIAQTFAGPPGPGRKPVRVR
jgi:uncharacterized protein (TIGR03084 family)